MLETYKYKIEFATNKDVYEQVAKMIREIAPESYFKIYVEREDVIFAESIINKNGGY